MTTAMKETGRTVGAYSIMADGSLVCVRNLRTAVLESFRPDNAPGEFDAWQGIARNGKVHAPDVAGLGSGPDLLAGRMVRLTRGPRREYAPCYAGRFVLADDGARVVLDWSGPMAGTRRQRRRKVARRKGTARPKRARSAPKRAIVERPSTVADAARRLVAERKATGVAHAWLADTSA